MTISKSAKKVTLELLAISLLIMPIVAFGQVTGGPETGSDILGLIRTITNWFAAVFFAIAVIFIILAAFGYLTAGGDEEKVGSAKKKLVYAVVAIVVAALAFFIPRIVLDILNVDVIEEPGVGID
ncbi:hypothetical protein A2127_00910 [Candidatus Jorgensenbacteria bacterium GWC1_48_12]|uniref:TrbC/VIRB2 family protein n=1 Tax=Candidatus Jorgensenbacteria bacterium GWC1_48_12 TaxID=1798469 RepID=A0A1F6BN29_9BACT|nr:MAG: hypothetical protein A2127_00910 [Candidatus Jorgensenbacteria bacterium GWC1_48_12]